jgi:hypothetical protein
MRHAILIALVLVGCRQQATPLTNPFLAPSRVPPPGTRTPPPGTALPYYDGNSLPPGLPPSGALQSQPGGGQLSQTVPRSGAGDPDEMDPVKRPAPPASRSLTAAPPADEIAVPGDDQSERFVQLASHDTADAPADAAAVPRPFPDIGDLPAVGRSPRDATQQPTLADLNHDRAAGDAFRPRGPAKLREQPGDVRTASFESPAPTPAVAAFDGRTRQSESPSRKRYAFDPEYAWLQGRLEYSRASEEWKLRYIPIDGETDEFGGSVVLSNPEQLGDLAAGDFVRVRGGLLERKSEGTSFAPMFRIDQIQPLAD